MAKTAKNKPKFLSVLLTAVFIAAGAFGVYKVCTYIESDPIPAFLRGETGTVASTQKTDKPETTTEPAADEAVQQLADEIGKADDSLSAEFLAYCADHFDAEALEKVRDAITGKDYDPEIWFTATGYSVHAIRAIAEDGVKDPGKSDKDTVEIGFVGKVNFGAMSSHAKDGKLSGCISADLLKLMNSMDVQVANNEFTFSADGSSAAFKADAKTAAWYKEMGVDVVSTANIHINDYGTSGLTATLSALDEAGIAHIGAGADLTEAAKPAYFIAGGRKIAFIGMGDTLEWKTVKAATGSSAGVLSLRKSMDAAKAAVKDARQESDFVFVYMSAGIDEKALWFDSDQSTWANAMIDAGADAVVGSHSSKLQGMQYYSGKLIAYGLGSFWYDEKTADSCLLKFTIDKEGNVKAYAVPCGQANGSVTLQTDAAKANTFAHIRKYCGNVVTIGSDGVITKTR